MEITLLIAPLGYLSGNVLSIIAPEEVDDGRRYFKAGHNVALLLLFALVSAHVYMSSNQGGTLAKLLGCIMLAGMSAFYASRLEKGMPAFAFSAMLLLLGKNMASESIILASTFVFLDGILCSGIDASKSAGKAGSGKKASGKDEEEVRWRDISEAAVARLPAGAFFTFLLEAAMVALMTLF
ncbi:hypothetical protein D6764_04315 [Candidatus Woesearchaeota archaeon]|nr:MAG: hypothetical protein D6764_04315 [Candidatus Woesearchaeota archaeon]